MKKTIQLIVVLLTSIFFTSCMITGVVGSRNVTTENRNIEAAFSGVKVSQGINLELTQDDKVSLSAEMDDNLHEILITEVEEGILHIYFDESVRKRKASNIFLSMPEINSIKTSSGADLTTKNTIKTNNLNLSSSSGSSMDIRVEAKSIECNGSSGSDIDLIGKCDILTVDASSGSSIDADELISLNVVAEASSGSSIDVHATESIDAKASSGGNIDCDGNPEKKLIKKSSGGQIDVD